MDGVDPDFSDETLDDVGLGIWPGQDTAPAGPMNAAPQQSVVEDGTAENDSPVSEESGFWNTGGARDFDWGD